jgi:glyoxylate carboligase
MVLASLHANGVGYAPIGNWRCPRGQDRVRAPRRPLIDWGVDTVFGLPGDGINGIMEGFRRHSDRIRFVLVHHEETAAFMATAYAKSTGYAA